jgi:hypothetical protein
MKKTYIFIAMALCMGLIYSCSKSGNTASAIDYTVNNLQNITVNNDDSTSLPVAITFVSGTQQPVSLSVSGLPSNVTVTPTSASGTPSYGTTFVFHANNADTGTYPITITAASAGTTSKTYNFNLTVTPSLNCATPLAGTYIGNINCQPSIGDSAVSCTVATTNTIDQISIDNFIFNGNSLLVNVNCTDNTLSIAPGQVASGSGTYTNNKITLNFTLTGGGYTCTDVLTR